MSDATGRLMLNLHDDDADALPLSNCPAKVRMRRVNPQAERSLIALTYPRRRDGLPGLSIGIVTVPDYKQLAISV